MMRKVLILIFIVSFVVMWHNDYKINEPAANCYEKILKLQKETINKTEKRSFYSKIIMKSKFIYLDIKYYFFDIFYSLKNKKIKQTITKAPLNNQQLYNEDKHKTKRIIAHAGGGINNHIYTDSLEALNENYKNGFRLFELDIRTTIDGIYVAVHNWEEWKNNTKYAGSIPPTIKDFKKHKLYNKYTLLDINDINKWFCEHEDAILITDKVNTPVEFSKKFIDKGRLRMELFTWRAIIEGVEEGIEVMPTWRILSTTKGDIVQKLLNLGISNIAASRRILSKNKTLLRELYQNKIHVYAFHINYDEGKDEKYVICNELNYFYGIYADKWDFNNKLSCEY